VFVTGLVVLLLASAPALAHHSFAAEFDANKPVKLTGTVTKVEWMNPHTWFYIDVKGEDGKVSRAKDGSNNANARAVVLASTGQRLFAASSQNTTP
jgi:hypothetical protein